MRRPMHSNVTRRRMFSNGGMGMTKPAASGILASSQPLVDVLAGQARDNLTNGINVGNQMYGTDNINVGNQMYGSNVQGTNLMNQGGIANYAPGGISYTTNEAGDVLRVPVSGSVEEAEIVNNEGLGMFAGMDSKQFNFSDQPGNRFGRSIAQKGAVELFDRRVEQGTQDPTKPMVLPDGTVVVRNANGETEIAVKGRQSGDDIYEANAPQNLTAENTGLPITKAEELLTFERRDMPTEQYPSETETETDVVTEGELPGYSNPDMSSSGGKKPDVIDYGSLIPPITDNSNNSNTEDDTKIEYASEDDVARIRENNGVIEPVIVTDDPYAITGGEGFDQPGYQVDAFVDEVLTNAEDKETTVTTMEQYKEEFRKAMPEYQGMSDEEKGNAWIKMGMAIASGQSPNAITNIANGVLATIDEFADDPKQKREYEMKVALAASKYAVENVNNDRTILKAYEANENELIYLLNPETNQSKTITKADLRAGKVPVGFMVSKDPVGDTIKNMNAYRALIVAETALIEAGKPDEITDKWASYGKGYKQAALKVIDSVQSKTLLGPAIEFLYNEDIPITGVKANINTIWNRITNAVGLTKNDLPLWNKSKKGGESREEYIARVEIVIAKKITAILGESNRTISEGDRTRADQIAGVFSDMWVDGSIKDPDLLKMKLRTLMQTLNNDERMGRAEMLEIRSTVGDKAVPGGEAFSYRDVLDTTGRLLLGDKENPLKVVTEEGNIVDYSTMFDVEGNLLQ